MLSSYEDFAVDLALIVAPEEESAAPYMIAAYLGDSPVREAIFRRPIKQVGAFAGSDVTSVVPWLFLAITQCKQQLMPLLTLDNIDDVLDRIERAISLRAAHDSNTPNDPSPDVVVHGILLVGQIIESTLSDSGVPRPDAVTNEVLRKLGSHPQLTLAYLMKSSDLPPPRIKRPKKKK